jgi:hypothetical protein
MERLRLIQLKPFSPKYNSISSQKFYTMFPNDEVEIIH